jgi:hypothetical protein
MRVVRVACLAAVVAGVWGAFPATSSAAPGPPSASCNGGGCGGWFRSNVTVTWSYDKSGVTGTTGCGPTTVSNDTTGATVTCTVNYGGPFYGNSVTVRKDSTPPSVTAALARGPDVEGWYTSPVAATFSGDGGPSGISSCTSGTYSGPDGPAVTLSGSCTDGAGNTGSATVTIKYDSTPPTVAPAPERPPDANGWYNRPVKVGFAGQDAGAGVRECSAPVTYAGPDASPARFVGQCRDAVGHLSAPVTFELRYDATRPARPTVEARRTSAAVSLSWKMQRDTVRVEVLRSSGKTGRKATVLYSGKAQKHRDRTAKAASRYWYEVRLYDEAGNVASRTVAVAPATGILAPATGAVVRRAPLVRWAPVRKARFYNVQVWRRRSKLLTSWPSVPRLRLSDSWTFVGKRQRLVNGRYEIFVWPAFGTVKEPRYGKLIGRVSFVVKRR